MITGITGVLWLVRVDMGCYIASRLSHKSMMVPLKSGRASLTLKMEEKCNLVITR